MKKTKFTESQIIKALKSHEAGRDVNDLCRELGVHRSTFYNWKKQYGGMEVKELKRLKELEEENRKLKQMYADLALDNKILKDVIEKKF
ncbi:transposase [Marivirga lumbricoides]|uniref:Transposase n=1 Tax=Marivirga lumbricoides TaxID=1046115 RepID=A0ABQ1L9F2_9BACT|nr:transposase [Marivirga lumbricoides]